MMGVIGETVVLFFVLLGMGTGANAWLRYCKNRAMEHNKGKRI
jgi:hypothetical protein